MSAVRILRSTWPHPQPRSSRAIGGHLSLRIQSYLQDLTHIHLSAVGRTICDHNASSLYTAIRVAQPPILALSPFHFFLSYCFMSWLPFGPRIKHNALVCCCAAFIKEPQKNYPSSQIGSANIWYNISRVQHADGTTIQAVP